jgi:hypothetical protein
MRLAKLCKGSILRVITRELKIENLGKQSNSTEGHYLTPEVRQLIKIKSKNMANKTEKIILKGRLDGTQRNKLARLLDMLYTPSELADEVGFTRRQVYRVYIHAGCPHSRDDRRHIWINGKDFREWCEQTYPRVSLGQDETFCLTCKIPVKIINPIRKQKGRLHYWISNCPNCGRKLARIITKDKLNK